MSLVPYHAQEGREIVLRHHNAIVVRDPSSQRLEIRSLAECPTCHRPLRASSPDRSHFGGDDAAGAHSSGSRHEGYVDPNYFRMLRASHQLRGARDPRSSSSARAVGGAGGATSPIRRLFQPLVGHGGGGSSISPSNSRSSTPAPAMSVDENSHAGTNAGRDSFSPVEEVVVIGPDGVARPSTATSAAPSTAPPSLVSGGSTTAGVGGGAEFLSSTPYVPPDSSSPIRKEAFSPNYFKTFFVEERELGRGGKGVVLLVRHEIDGCLLGHFACKRVPVGDDHAWLEKVLVEVELLAKLSHPNLVSYRHVWLENVTLTRFGPSVACAFILQQYCNSGDLHHYIIGDQPKEATKEELKAQMRRRSKGSIERPQDLFDPTHRQLQFDEIYSLFRDVTSGLAYLHAANYIHRDLKPSNCLLHREGRNLTCLISDFGEVQAENVVRKSTGTTGTISYCAPEVLRQDPSSGLYGNFTTKSDIFSLGMILYFMCFGRLPYRSANIVNEDLEDITALRAEISDWTGFHYERRERPDLPSKLYQLLTRMLSVNPAERPSANDVLLAMRTDSANGFDGFVRGSAPAMAPSLGINNRRIQNLDSPVPSGTPVPDPTKQNRGSAMSPDVDVAVFDSDDEMHSRPQNSLQRHRTSTSLTLTRSQRSHDKSPERVGRINGSGSIEARQRRGSSAASSPRSPLRRPSPLESRPSHDSNNATHNGGGTTINTPLLMPPPTTFLGEVRHRGLVAQHHARLFAQRHAESVAFLFRTALFLVKMISLTRPCWPFMVRFGVGASLVAVAGLDLGIPATMSARMVGNQSNNHYQRRPLREGQEWMPPPPPSIWRWDWRVSILLLALHFLVLGLASRSEVLCTGSSHETWEATW